MHNATAVTIINTMCKLFNDLPSFDFIQISSFFVMPNAAMPIAPGYYLDADQDSPRNAPEYINIRHRVVDEKVEDVKR
jgi:hypothetical protein